MSGEQTAQLWRPADGVHLAWIAEDLVLLHVAADRYLCVPGAAPAVSETPEGLRLLDQVLAGDLAEAGLIEPAKGARFQGAARPRPATATAIPERAGRLRLGDVADMTACLADLGLTYRGRSFPALLDAVRSSRPRHPRSDAGELVETAQAFQRWLPYAPAAPKCLLRAFMLLRLLHRRGLDADWVFGVATWPFRAHCWLQAGEVALDEHPERLRAFTPILVV